MTRTANPLGKIIDYVQEDIDSMKKELETWQREATAYTSQQADTSRLDCIDLTDFPSHVHSAADAQLVPLRAQLRDLEQQIGDREELIRTVKGNIARNDARIKARFVDWFICAVGMLM